MTNSNIPEPTDQSPLEELGLREVINVNGTMTSIGASLGLAEVGQAMQRILPHFVEMDALQRKAGEQIAKSTGAESGYITASSAAALTLSVAACMAGRSLAKVEQLPDTTGMRSEVLLQMGHAIHYGAPVEQGLRLSGAKVRLVGSSTLVEPYQLEAAITERTACAMYVVSHHVVNYGQIALPVFIEICRAKCVPVIVDAASEYDLRCFIKAGADAVIYSAHKFLSGPTAGIVAGNETIISNMLLQNKGIGRGFKVGKESIYGALVALQMWEGRDHAAIRAKEESALAIWQGALKNRKGITAWPEDDPTGNPLRRLRVQVNPELAGTSATALVKALAAFTPPIIARNHEEELGYFYLDPCNLKESQAQVVADALNQLSKP